MRSKSWSFKSTENSSFSWNKCGNSKKRSSSQGAGKKRKTWRKTRWILANSHQVRKCKNWGKWSKNCSRSTNQRCRNCRIWLRKVMRVRMNCWWWFGTKKLTLNLLIHSFKLCWKTLMCLKLGKGPPGRKIVKYGRFLTFYFKTRSKKCHFQRLMGSNAWNSTENADRSSLKRLKAITWVREGLMVTLMAATQSRIQERRPVRWVLSLDGSRPETLSRLGR